MTSRKRARLGTPVLIDSEDDDEDEDDDDSDGDGETGRRGDDEYGMSRDRPHGRGSNKERDHPELAAVVAVLPRAPIPARPKRPAGHTALPNSINKLEIKRRKTDGAIDAGYDTDRTISNPVSRGLSPIDDVSDASGSAPEPSSGSSPDLAMLVGTPSTRHRRPRQLDVHAARRLIQHGIGAPGTPSTSPVGFRQPQSSVSMVVAAPVGNTFGNTVATYVRSKVAELEQRPPPDGDIVIRHVEPASSTPPAAVDIEAMLAEFQNATLRRREIECNDFGDESEHEDVLSDDDDDGDTVTIGDTVYFDGGFGQVRYCSNRHGQMEVGLEMETITELRSYTDGFVGANFYMACKPGHGAITTIDLLARSAYHLNRFF